MAILNVEERLHGSGFTKELDPGAIEMILDNIQKSQYIYPIKSTTRELACNGVDSIAEKQVAIKILTGAAKEEDFFVKREGKEFKDSSFDPDYYNLSYFSPLDKVSIIYKCGAGVEKDTIFFKDTGVGLGGKRLEGYFRPGYSTKRLSKLPIGKYGIGAKVPFSTRVPYFTADSWYNGMHFKFNVYSYDFDSLIPPFNINTGQPNNFILFDEGTPKERPVYFEETEEFNGFQTSFSTKKNHRKEYIDAVRSQLLYFDNIELLVIEEDGSIKNVDYKSEILFENDKIAIALNDYYSKPHILINRVNYGYINFEELELSDYRGNIGIKVAPEEVEVTPSRESIVWSEETKLTVMNRFKEVKKLASELLNKELMVDDFILWLRNTAAIRERFRKSVSSNNPVIARLADIAELRDINYKFNVPGTSIELKDELNGIYARFVYYETVFDKETRSRKTVISRSFNSHAFRENINSPIFLKEEGVAVSNRKDKYILSMYPSGFTIMERPYFLTEEELETSNIPAHLYEILKKGPSVEKLRVIWDLIEKSSFTSSYEEVVIPEDFKETEEETKKEDKPEKEEVEEKVKEVVLSREERRKQNKLTILSTPIQIPDNSALPKVFKEGEYKRKMVSWNSIEVPISSINDWDCEEIYYGTSVDTDLLEFVSLISDYSERTCLENNYGDTKIISTVTRFYADDGISFLNSKYWNLNALKYNYSDANGSFINHYAAFKMHNFVDARVVLIKIAAANTKLYRDFQHVSEFFLRIKNNVITMSNTLIKWNTSRKLISQIKYIDFYYNFDLFDTKLSSLYTEICNYIEHNYKPLDRLSRDAEKNHWGITSEAYNDLVSHCDSIEKFQTLVASNMLDKEEIASYALRMFGNNSITDGMAVDMSVIEKLNTLNEHSLSIRMLNRMEILRGYPDSKFSDDFVPLSNRNKFSIGEELEFQIKDYIISKKS